MIRLAEDWKDYSVIATGDGYKLERWGETVLLRPDPQVIWSAQRDLFAYIGDHPTGITINESCLMQPIKSVSGIIGIGDEVRKRPYGCDICNSASCAYRNIRRKKH